MLQLADLFFTLLHLAIIGFNLLGWIWKRTRRAHLYSILITAGSWLLLGIWYGLGYCPVTDWQWRVKRLRGETNLPDSFIKYFADKISGRNWDAELVNNATAIVFILLVVIAVAGNLLQRKQKIRPN